MSSGRVDELSALRLEFDSLKSTFAEVLQSLNWSEEDFVATSENRNTTAKRRSEKQEQIRRARRERKRRLTPWWDREDEDKESQETYVAEIYDSCPGAVKLHNGVEQPNEADEDEFAERIRKSRPEYRGLDVDYNLTSYTKSQDEERRQKSKMAMLELQRDYKRRRRTYRAKNVHITKRTPTQIMRDLITPRMEALSVLATDKEDGSKRPHRERTHSESGDSSRHSERRHRESVSRKRERDGSHYYERRKERGSKRRKMDI